MNEPIEREYLILKIPADAWDTILETLQMDIDSSAIAPDIRKDIDKATHQIKTIEINVLEVVQTLYRILLKFKQFYPAIFPEAYNTALEAAKIAINELQSESHDPSESVSLIAGGYEWNCPNCNAENSETAWLPKVTCQTCDHEFTTNPPDHALEN